MRKIILLCIISAAIMCGCSGDMPEKKNTPERTDSLSDMSPEDTPWNRIIMETDSGYYYNAVQGVLSMRYTEKSTGADIFLCAKPECMHDGSLGCTATYNFLTTSNFVLYEGNIYFISDDRDGDTAGCALYRCAPDGSSLDKVGDVRRVKAPAAKNDGIGNEQMFLIHKGYAYIPYTIGQHSYTDFIETGFAKMDIRTGAVEMIYSSDDYFSALSTSVQAGCGDHIYYEQWGQSGGGYYRYNINDGTSRKIFDEIKAIKEGKAGITAYTEDAVYINYADNGHRLTVEGYDSRTFQPSGVRISSEEFNLGSSVIAYKGRIYICGDKAVKVYSEQGELITEIPCTGSGIEFKEDEDAYYYSDSRSLAISDDRLYMRYRGEDVPHYSDEYSVCSIPLDGSGQWEPVYEVKGWENYWKENPVITKLAMMERE